jgi:hypothetical protein
MHERHSDSAAGHIIWKRGGCATEREYSSESTGYSTEKRRDGNDHSVSGYRKAEELASFAQGEVHTSD